MAASVGRWSLVIVANRGNPGSLSPTQVSMMEAIPTPAPIASADARIERAFAPAREAVELGNIPGAVLGVIGLMSLSGWISRLAGAIAIIAFGLIVVELARADATLPDAIGPGLWWMLGGGVVMVIGSLVAPTRSTTSS